jgi:hypothetical protein
MKEKYRGRFIILLKYADKPCFDWDTGLCRRNCL